ncbi:flagellar biosynthesis protein FliQ [Desulfurispora thermophila]|uniref:flagellar biosynthesis protein FliQ n=1 Tax=Desulfurispora thermophila TaxID=265470 RepID=UPI00036B5BA6
MTDTMVIKLIRDAFYMVLLISLPPLAAGMLVGLVVSILQAATQVQEQSLSFVPKLVAVFITLAVLTPWIIHVTVRYAAEIFRQLPQVAR